MNQELDHHHVISHGRSHPFVVHHGDHLFTNLKEIEKTVSCILRFLFKEQGRVREDVSFRGRNFEAVQCGGASQVLRSDVLTGSALQTPTSPLPLLLPPLQITVPEIGQNRYPSYSLKAVASLMGNGEEAKERRRKVKEVSQEAKKAIEVGGSSYNAVKEIMEEFRLFKSRKVMGMAKA
ncbi:hypothetical protein K1719_042993 [Acacia pycnantha]|nr:hypothetical protein K1719_042993 [Acacia pycnantha]